MLHRNPVPLLSEKMFPKSNFRKKVAPVSPSSSLQKHVA